MKSIFSAVLAAALFAANTLHAQLPLSSSDLAAIEATSPTPAGQLPSVGTFYSAANPQLPPAPENISGLSGWDLGNLSGAEIYLLDDLEGSSGVMDMSSGGGFHAMDDSGPLPPGGDGGGAYAFTNTYSGFPTGGLYLQIVNISNDLVTVNLNNATDAVYEVYSLTNLSMTTTLSNWNIETEMFPGVNTNTLPFTVPMNGRNPLFLWARDWTGITTDGNQTPSWWFWLYYGTVDLSDTDLDSSGQHTLLYDYENKIDPNILDFISINVTNTDCNVNPAPIQINVTGTPYYVAILVDDNNLNDAVWETYNSSNITVNLGSVEGPHEVLIGLRGYADAPSDATWLGTELNLDLASPVLVITNPAVGTITTPIVQLQGYSSEHLTSITYDVANSAGTVTNRPALVLDQFYDTNLLEYTTNYFQCFDVPLVTGPNTITLRATDLAGNVTTTNFTIDYSSPTNPPVFQLNWPQNGTQISGNNFTWRGYISDPTAQIVAQIVNTNGVTNTVTGQVGRSGDFWVYGLPLSGGTNYLSLAATDAAGNESTTNIAVIQSPLVLAITSAAFGQPVQGTISDWTNYTVWVNGVIATNNGNGTWTAYPTITLDTTVVQVRAIPNSDNGGYGGGQ